MFYAMMDAQTFRKRVNLLLTVPMIVAINKVDKPKVNVVCWFIFESLIKGFSHVTIDVLLTRSCTQL